MKSLFAESRPGPSLPVILCSICFLEEKLEYGEDKSQASRK